MGRVHRIGLALKPSTPAVGFLHQCTRRLWLVVGSTYRDQALHALMSGVLY